MTAILHLKSITCLQQAEDIGSDELYVTFNGTKKLLPDMTRGSVELLSDEFLFDGSPRLSLFENDGNHWYDRDDFIDAHDITESPDDLTLDFKASGGHASGAHYQLSISITPIEGETHITAILHLKSITCLQQAEDIGSDELYVTFNGTKKLLPDMTTGSEELLSDEFLFDGLAWLSLFENDGDHWYDRDDFIDTHKIIASPGDFPLDFEASRRSNAAGAHYQLNVSITPIGVPLQKFQNKHVNL